MLPPPDLQSPLLLQFWFLLSRAEIADYQILCSLAMENHMVLTLIK